MPSGAWKIYGTRGILHLHSPPPNFTAAPSGESAIEHQLQALHALLETFTGRQTRVALDQLVARWGERGIRCREAFNPAPAVQVGYGEPTLPRLRPSRLPTGTGKSLAYLAAAILLGRKVVSTATIDLQT